MYNLNNLTPQQINYISKHVDNKFVAVEKASSLYSKGAMKPTLLIGLTNKKVVMIQLDDEDQAYDAFIINNHSRAIPVNVVSNTIMGEVNNAKKVAKVA